MNPFEEEFSNELNNKLSLIEIWVETNGRKKNTFISGWELTDLELKEHIKTIKKKNGCNGSLKEYNNNDNIIKVIQLQGDHTDYMHEYLLNNDIDESSIKIKG